MDNNESLYTVVSVLVALVVIWFVIRILFFTIKAGVKSGVREVQNMPTENNNRPTPVIPKAVEGFSVLPALGRYKISGVDKASRLDTVWHCHADSEANARVKAELEGIIVTAIEFEGGEPTRK